MLGEILVRCTADNGSEWFYDDAEADAETDPAEKSVLPQTPGAMLL